MEVSRQSIQLVELILTVQLLPPLHLPNHHPVQALEQLLPAGP